MSGKVEPFFLFAPGAGAPSSSPWMTAWAARLATLGGVMCFDYPYMLAGRKSPDRPPTLLAAHGEALKEARKRAAGAPVYLVGKSMGGRMGCHLAADEEVAGVVCLGYPLQAQSTGALRDQVLLALRVPILFLQGSRDPLCPLDRLAEVRARMAAPNALIVVEGGDHSLQLSAAHRKVAGITQESSDARVLEAVRSFVSDLQRR